MKTQEQKTEKELTNIEKFIAIQNELKVPKGNLNKFGNYRYRSAEDILEALKPILFKYKAVFKLSDKLVKIGNKIFVKAIARIKIGDFKEFAFGYAELSEHKGMSSEQATGTASSYARKYALNGLFLIDETETDADHDNKKESDADNNNKKETPKKPILRADTDKFGDAVEYLMKGGSIDAIKAKYEVSQEVETKLIKSI
jgi:hypothetical protein